MDLFSQDISRFVFRSNIRRDMGQVSLSSTMLEVLHELDGTKDALAVARSLQLNMNTIREILSQLFERKLIERVETRREFVNRTFFKSLEGRLAEVMGPMAGVLIREEVSKMGEESEWFPQDRTQELIDRLASKIFVETKKEAFLRTVKGD